MKTRKPSLSAWKMLRSDTLLDTPVYSIKRQLYSNPDIPAPVPFYLMDSRDCVNIFAIDRDNPHDPEAQLLLVEQFRIGNNQVGFETPGGFCDLNDASNLVSARRELVEETGAVARDWVFVGSIDANSAMMKQKVHVYLALSATIDEKLAIGDGHEVIDSHWIKLSEFPEKVAAGQITHCVIIAAWALLQAKLKAGKL